MANNELNPKIWRKKPHRSSSLKTVEAILQTAEKLFATDGYYKTTTNHIADKAGVGIGSLYDYFPNREAIALALLEQTATALSDEVRELFATHLDEQITQIIPVVFGKIFSWYKAHQNILITLVDEAPELRTTSQMLSIEKLLARTSRLYLSQHQQELPTKNLDSAHEFISLAVIATIKQYLSDNKVTLPEDLFLENLHQLAVSFLQAEGTSS